MTTEKEFIEAAQKATGRGLPKVFSDLHEAGFVAPKIPKSNRKYDFHDMEIGEVREFETLPVSGRKSNLQMALHRHAQVHGWGVKTKVMRKDGVWRVERVK